MKIVNHSVNNTVKHLFNKRECCHLALKYIGNAFTLFRGKSSVNPLKELGQGDCGIADWRREITDVYKDFRISGLHEKIQLELMRRQGPSDPTLTLLYRKDAARIGASGDIDAILGFYVEACKNNLPILIDTKFLALELGKLSDEELCKRDTILQQIAGSKPKEVLEFITGLSSDKISELDTTLQQIAKSKPAEVLELIEGLNSEKLSKLHTALDQIAELKFQEVLEFIKKFSLEEILKLSEGLNSEKLNKLNTAIEQVAELKAQEVLELIKGLTPKEFSTLDLTFWSIACSRNEEVLKLIESKNSLLEHLRNEHLYELDFTFCSIAESKPEKVLELIESKDLNPEQLSKLHFALQQVAESKPEKVLELIESKDLNPEQLSELDYALQQIAKSKPEKVLELIESKDLNPKQLSELDLTLKQIAKSKPEKVLEFMEKLNPEQLSMMESTLKQIAKSKPEKVLEFMERLSPEQLSMMESTLFSIVESKPEKVLELIESKNLGTEQLRKLSFIFQRIAESKTKEVLEFMEKLSPEQLSMMESTLFSIAESKPEKVLELIKGLNSEKLSKLHFALQQVAKSKPERVLELIESKDLNPEQLSELDYALQQIAESKPERVLRLIESKNLGTEQLRKLNFALKQIAKSKPERVLEFMQNLSSEQLSELDYVLFSIAASKHEKVLKLIESKNLNPEQLGKLGSTLWQICNLNNFSSGLIAFYESNNGKELIDIAIKYRFPIMNYLSADFKNKFIPEILGYLSGLSVNERKMFFNTTNPLELILNGYANLNFKKEGSELSIFASKQHGAVFLNTISTTSYKVWQNLHDGGEVPVAIILGIESEQGDTTTVQSRYSGINLYSLMSRFPRLKKLILEAQRQSGEIKSKLQQLNIYHGHTNGGDFTHDGNLTIEFIDKDYLSMQLKAGKNINTLEYDPKMFTFEPQEYIKNSKKWKPVVRLIDWDQGKPI